jgi:hypothetical protein
MRADDHVADQYGRRVHISARVNHRSQAIKAVAGHGSFLHKAMRILTCFVSYLFYIHKDKKAYHLNEAFPTTCAAAQKQPLNPIK